PSNGSVNHCYTFASHIPMNTKNSKLPKYFGRKNFKITPRHLTLSIPPIAAFFARYRLLS
ncbi:hypothetical protein ACEV9Y_14460, partial [Vibrio parahaemolyticus]